MAVGALLVGLHMAAMHGIIPGLPWEITPRNHAVLHLQAWQWAR